MRRLFWPLIAAASLQEALAVGCLATAAFSDPIPRRLTSYGPPTGAEVFGRQVSLSWSADRGMLIAAIVFAVTGFGTFLIAARAR